MVLFLILESHTLYICCVDTNEINCRDGRGYGLAQKIIEKVTRAFLLEFPGLNAKREHGLEIGKMTDLKTNYARIQGRRRKNEQIDL